MLEESLIAKQYRQIWFKGRQPLEKEFDLKGIDDNAKDYQRVLRLPGSFNPKAQEYCKIVAKNDSENKIDALKMLEDLEKELCNAPLQTFEPQETPNTCNVCEYALTHFIPEGKRQHWLAPNVAAYIRNQPNKAELERQFLAVQQASYGCIQGWDKTNSKFSCWNLIQFAFLHDLQHLCEKCPLQGGDFNE